MENLRQLFLQMIQAEPSQVRLLLYDYHGYLGPVDPDALLAGYILYGEQFLLDLFAIFSFDSAEGESYSKFQQFVNDALSIISTGKTLANVATNTTSGTSPSEEEEAKKQQKMWRVFLISISALIIALLIFLIATRKRS